MAMRLRRINSRLVALCAAKTTPQSNDIYIDDEQDHAIRVKLERDFNFEGLMNCTPYQNTEVWKLIELEENEEN